MSEEAADTQGPVGGEAGETGLLERDVADTDTDVGGFAEDEEKDDELVVLVEGVAACLLSKSAARRISLCESREQPVRPSEEKVTPKGSAARRARSMTFGMSAPNFA
jgi:hypothetical protein